jgi:predicted nucleic-acid-binding protein
VLWRSGSPVKALDTNCLVRFLVRDDRKQGARIRDLFRKAEEEQGKFLVTVAVVLELLWVLESVYRIPPEEVITGLENLLRLPILEFERRKTLLGVIEQGRKAGLALPDLLIGLLGRDTGCEKTLTFDRRAARSGLFELL